MSFLKNSWILLSMLFACWALIASFLAGYYWLQYMDIRTRVGGLLINVNLGIDYGNGSRTWQNNTKALTGQTLLDVTKQVSDVTYRTGILGTEIVSINGVSKHDAWGWTYWAWNGTDRSWSVIWETTDNHFVRDEATYMWYYQSGFDSPP